MRLCKHGRSPLLFSCNPFLSFKCFERQQAQAILGVFQRREHNTDLVSIVHMFSKSKWFAAVGNVFSRSKATRPIVMTFQLNCQIRWSFIKFD